ncbi:hypothetical protein BC629DRAFT_1037034 [Irpex lacteus]|nr:hypothetical protein BC629DRAFT_1037034 [Irpex lacteus]
MLGGLSWFAVPWAFASCFGPAARALLHNPKFPSYPSPLSASQVNTGLAASAAATIIMGQAGARAILMIVVSSRVIPLVVTSICNCTAGCVGNYHIAFKIQRPTFTASLCFIAFYFLSQSFSSLHHHASMSFRRVRE